MGKSAKVHKRVPKKSKALSANLSTSASGSSSSSHNQVVQSAKKRAKLKGKAISTTAPGTSSDPSKGVLGDADYVSLLMGGRRKAKEEALKLPQKPR